MKKCGLCTRCYKAAWHAANRDRIKARRKSHGNNRKNGPRATASFMSAMALSAAERAEEGVAQLKHFLGMNAPRLPHDVESILVLVMSLTQPVEYPHVTNPEYIRYWAGVFFALDDRYLEQLGKLLKNDEPWRLFTNFANRLTQKLLTSGAAALIRSPSLNMAEKYLTAAKAHLWHVSFELCRRRHGYATADQLFNGKPQTPISALVAAVLLH